MSAGSNAAAATFWRQLPRNRLALAGAGMLLFALGLAVFAPLLAPEDPRRALLATTYSIQITRLFYLLSLNHVWCKGVQRNP